MLPWRRDFVISREGGYNVVMHRTFFNIFFVISAIIGIFVIMNYSISTHVVPNLSDYLASTTPSFATEATSTAQQVATTTSTVAQKVTKEPTIALKAPRKTLRIIVATTTEAMSLGLGGRASLPQDYGMLFIFSTAQKPGFWMKEMQFPIDMIWINSAKKVVGITREVLPEHYPEMYFPPSPISYVLEINSGTSADFGIATGTTLLF